MKKIKKKIKKTIVPIVTTAEIDKIFKDLKKQISKSTNTTDFSTAKDEVNY